jgi:hypothetical protein
MRAYNTEQVLAMEPNRADDIEAIVSNSHVRAHMGAHTRTS